VTFEEALEAVSEGQIARRVVWPLTEGLYPSPIPCGDFLLPGWRSSRDIVQDDLSAEDWIIQGTLQ